MGREIRKVAKGWEHPKNARGHYQPVYNTYYGDAVKEWIEQHLLWLDGKHVDQLADPEGNKEHKFYAEAWGNCPDVEYYLPVKWTEEEACCFQYYETVSEGTPVSPVFDTLLELEDWLVNREGHSRQAAKNFCESGWAPSFTMSISPDGVKNMKSGVDTCE